MIHWTYFEPWYKKLVRTHNLILFVSIVAFCSFMAAAIYMAFTVHNDKPTPSLGAIFSWWFAPSFATSVIMYFFSDECHQQFLSKTK
jgi:hypothetical protein